MSQDIANFIKGQFLKSLGTPEWIGRVTLGMMEAIDLSFKTDEVLRPVRTKDELRRRFEICKKWFITLRLEENWSIPAILDELPTILRTELDGNYVPKRNVDEIISKTMGRGKEKIAHISSRWIDEKAGSAKLENPGEDIAEEVPELTNYVDAIEAEGVLGED